MPRVCFWSIGDGKHSYILQALVDSFHAVGMKEDFHVFADRKIEGATTHSVGTFNKKRFLFKFDFLRDRVKELDYDLFIFLDADNYFVRKPPFPLENLMQGASIHAFFENDCTKADPHKLWWRCPVGEFVHLMRECGITDEKVYNVNAGFFIVQREAIDVVCGLALDFWENASRHGYELTEEAPLAYAAQMLCNHPEKHLLRDHFNVWCSDWKGYYTDRMPDGKEWIFPDYMTLEPYTVNPAIIHAIRSKEAMVNAAREHHLTL